MLKQNENNLFCDRQETVGCVFFGVKISPVIAYNRINIYGSKHRCKRRNYQQNSLQNKLVPEKYQQTLELDDSFSVKQEVAEINKFVDAQKSTNTVNKTNSDINTWEKFCTSDEGVRKLSEIRTVRINKLLQASFLLI